MGIARRGPRRMAAVAAAVLASVGLVACGSGAGSAGTNSGLTTVTFAMDYLPGPALVAPTPAGRGAQVSLFGLVGVLAGWDEGLEVNVLGLTFGVDPKAPALKLPVVGRLGAP